jgi:hypothetical protein
MLPMLSSAVATTLPSAIEITLELCQMSRDGCEPLMNRFGFNWPEQMECERFPGKPNRFNKLSSFNYLQRLNM